MPIPRVRYVPPTPNFLPCHRLDVQHPDVVEVYKLALRENVSRENGGTHEKAGVLPPFPTFAPDVFNIYYNSAYK